MSAAALILGCSATDTVTPINSGAENSTDETDSGQAAGESPAETPTASTTGPDVCGPRPDIEWGAPAQDGYVTVPAADPRIRFSGRVDCSDLSAPSFAYPAATVALRFEGTGVDFVLRDHGTATAQTTNFYDVEIDGAPAVVLEALPGEEVYSLARDLQPGEHTVKVIKRTESGPVGRANSGKGEFLGLRLPEGARLLPVAVSGRRVEFVGDSITCGYGNELSTDDPDSAHYTSANSNANNAYGAIAARLLDAEYTAVSYSGKGVSRNVSGDAGALLPEIYARSFPDDAASPLFPFDQAAPDVLVVNLGTNDFSPGGVDRVDYVQSYVEFLTTLRGYYPDASLVCAIGPMLSDFYPAGENAWTNARADVQEVIARRVADGDGDVHYLEFAPQTPPYGEDWHPTVATHTKMAEQTAQLIRELRGW